MFSKRAVVITQCIGAGGKWAVKDMKDSLSWWGISHIGVFKMPLMEDIVWDQLSPKRQQKLTAGMRRLGRRTAAKIARGPAEPSLLTKLKFGMCRMMQLSVVKAGKAGVDARYWQEQGWLGKTRPW